MDCSYSKIYLQLNPNRLTFPCQEVCRLTQVHWNFKKITLHAQYTWLFTIQITRQKVRFMYTKLLLNSTNFQSFLPFVFIYMVLFLTVYGGMVKFFLISALNVSSHINSGKNNIEQYFRQKTIHIQANYFPLNSRFRFVPAWTILAYCR